MENFVCSSFVVSAEAVKIASVSIGRVRRSVKVHGEALKDDKRRLESFFIPTVVRSSHFAVERESAESRQLWRLWIHWI